MSEHQERHKELHNCLDELVADFIKHTARFPSQVTVLELMEWSNEQTKQPTDLPQDDFVMKVIQQGEKDVTD